MSNKVFPTLRGITYPITKMPQWNTKRQISATGIERSASYWATPRWTFKLPLTFTDDTGDPNDTYNQIVGFFMQMRGSFDSFLFTDKDVTRQVSTYNLTNGITNIINMNSIGFGGFTQPIDNKNIIFDAITSIDYGLKIYNSDPDTTQDYMDEPDTYMDDPDTYMGADMPNFYLYSDFVISNDIITGYGYKHTGYFPPNSKLKVYFNYFFRCRFLEDQTQFETFLYNLTENKSVELITLK